MNSPLNKIIVAFVLLVLFLLGTSYMYFRIGYFKGIEKPRVPLSELPRQLGDWKGEDRETDERMFRATQASEVQSRAYSNASGKTVTLHMATYFDFWYDVPHSPLVCYPSSGWTTVRTTNEELQMADTPSGTPPLNAAFALFEMEGRHELILYWYQLGEQTFSDNQGLREAQKKVRNLKAWPSLVKVLLSTEASNSEIARKRLIEFGSRVYGWSSQMQNGLQSSPSVATSNPAAAPTPPENPASPAGPQ